MPLSLNFFFYLRVGKLRGQPSSESVDIKSRWQERYLLSKRKEDSDLLNTSIWGVGRCQQINLFYFSALYLCNLLKTTTSSRLRAALSMSFSDACVLPSPPFTVDSLPSLRSLQPFSFASEKQRGDIFFFPSSFIKMNVLTPCWPPGK